MTLAQAQAALTETIKRAESGRWEQERFCELCSEFTDLPHPVQHAPACPIPDLRRLLAQLPGLSGWSE